MKKTLRKRPATRKTRRLTAKNISPKRRKRNSKFARARKAIAEKKRASLQSLGRLQRRFVIWSANSSNEQLSDRLRRFVPESESFWKAVERAGETREGYEAQLLDDSRIRSRIGGVNRGARLVFSAADWRRPIMGYGKGTVIARGVQWRTAIAWAGLELIGNSLFPRINNCEADVFLEWCQLVGHIKLAEEIAVPNGLKRSAKIRNLWREDVEILEFLNVRGGKPKRALDTWWVKQTPISDYATALHAARAIRDITSHGLLSAHRVEKFGLISRWPRGTTSPLDRLTEAIVTIAYQTLKRILDK
jgi:hypothetical protein